MTVTSKETGSEAPAEEAQPPETEALETTETLEQETDWDAVDTGLDLDGDVPAETEVEEPTGEAEGDAVRTQEEVKTPPAAEAEAEVTPESKTPAVEETKEEKETPPETPPVDVDALWSQREQALVEEHRIDDELADLVFTDPKEHLPKLLAKAQARAERMIWENVNEAMPEAIQRVLDQQQTETKQKDEFYEMWPQLREYVEKNPDAEMTITRMRDMFAHQPGVDKMSRADFIKQVGAAAAVALGLSPEAVARTPAKPAAPARQTPRSSPRARSANADSGKKLGAFEELDAGLDPDDAPSKGAALF